MQEKLRFIRHFLLYDADGDYTKLIFYLEWITSMVGDSAMLVYCYDIRKLTRDLLIFPQEDNLLRVIITNINRALAIYDKSTTAKRKNIV